MTNLPNPAPLPCPPWCTTDHAAQDRWQADNVARIRARTGETPEWMARWHTCDVAEIPNPEAASQPVRISLYRDDSLVDPDPDRAVVSAEHADTMHPDTASKVAAAILAAVEVARGKPRCAECVAGHHDQCTGSPAGGNACQRCCWPEDVGDRYEYVGPNIRRAALS